MRTLEPRQFALLAEALDMIRLSVWTMASDLIARHRAELADSLVAGSVRDPKASW